MIWFVFFYDRTKLKILSEIKPPLKDHGCIRSVAGLCHYHCHNSWIPVQRLHLHFPSSIKTGKGVSDLETWMDYDSLSGKSCENLNFPADLT